MCRHRTVTSGVAGFRTHLPTSRDRLTLRAVGSPCLFSFVPLGRGVLRQSVRRTLIGSIAGLLLRLNANFTFLNGRCRLGINNSSFCVSLLFCGLDLHYCIIVRLGANRFGPRCTKRLGFCLSTMSKLLGGRRSRPSVNLLLYGDGGSLITRCSLGSVDGPVKIDTCHVADYLPRRFRGRLPSIRSLRGQVLWNEFFPIPILR